MTTNQYLGLFITALALMICLLKNEPMSTYITFIACALGGFIIGKLQQKKN